jgi:outer membrane lipoprotein SlyB
LWASQQVCHKPAAFGRSAVAWGSGARIVIRDRRLSGSALALALTALAACGPNYSPNTYSSAAVQQASKVETGVIVGVRRVDISAPGTTGAVAGAAAGGIAGTAATQGSSSVTTALTALGGGLVGGILGTEAEHKLNDTFGYEYIVRKANGDMVSVTQKDDAPLAIGLHVLVIAGPQARIVSDYTVPVEGDKKAEAKPDAAKPETKVDVTIRLAPDTPANRAAIEQTPVPQAVAPTPPPAAKVEPPAEAPVAVMPLAPPADKPADAPAATASVPPSPTPTPAPSAADASPPLSSTDPTPADKAPDPVHQP